MEGHKHIHVRVHVRTHTHTHAHTGGGERRVETNRTMSPSAVSPKIAETEQLHQAQRMIGGIGNVLFSRPILTFENRKDPKVSCGEPLKHVITVRRQILVSRTDYDPAPRVWLQKRLRVHVQNVSVVPAYTGTFWTHTRRRFLNPNTCFSTFFQRAATHMNTRTHTHQTHHDHQTTPQPQRHTPHNTTHNITRRQRETERQRKRDKTRQEKIQDKTKEDGGETRQQDKRRWRRDETRRQEKIERREETRQEERRSNTREETRWRERWKKRFFFKKKKVSRPSNPPDELAQNVSKKKNPSRMNYSSIFCKSSESDRFFIYLHVSSSIFRAGWTKSERFRNRTVMKQIRRAEM